MVYYSYQVKKTTRRITMPNKTGLNKQNISNLTRYRLIIDVLGVLSILHTLIIAKVILIHDWSDSIPVPMLLLFLIAVLPTLYLSRGRYHLNKVITRAKSENK